MATKKQKEIADEKIVLAMAQSACSVTMASSLLKITPQLLRSLIARNPALRVECEEALEGRIRALAAKALDVMETQVDKGSVKAANAILSRVKIWDGVQINLGNEDKPKQDKVATKKADDVWEKFVKEAPKDKDGAIVVGN